MRKRLKTITTKSVAYSFQGNRLSYLDFAPNLQMAVRRDNVIRITVRPVYYVDFLNQVAAQLSSRG